MIWSTLRVELPADLWIAAVSASFPTATFELLAGVTRGDRALEFGRIRSEHPTQVLRAVESHEHITECERVLVDEHQCLAHYEVLDQRLYELMSDFSLPLEFPLTVTDGWLEFDVTVSNAQFTTIKSRLAAGSTGYEVLSVLHDRSPSDVLTPRQWECLTFALRRGYYEIPRDCTLAELAAQLQIDPSTLNDTLRRAERRIVQWVVARRSWNG